MKKTVLIFGISSFVGSNLAEFLSDEFRIIGTYSSTPVSIPGITCLPCDVLKKDYVNNLVLIFRPDITLYAVGMSSLSECKAAPKLADALNSVGAANVARASERVGAKFVYLSSSFVLGGEDITYKEGDTPLPNTAYGNSVSAAEFFVQRSSINYLILRSCPLYGWSYNPLHPNYFDAVQSALAKGQTIQADDLISTGFLDIAIFAKVLKSCLELNITNRLLQVSSSNVMTRFQFAKECARIFRKDESLIQNVSLGLPLEGQGSKNQARSKSFIYRMDTSNLESAIGSKLPLIEESLQFTFKRLSGRISAKSS